MVEKQKVYENSTNPVTSENLPPLVCFLLDLSFVPMSAMTEGLLLAKAGSEHFPSSPPAPPAAPRAGAAVLHVGKWG